MTAFPATERALREMLAGAELDAASFARPLRRCSLEHCRGTCCTEGVYLNAEVALVLRTVLRRERDFFAALGIEPEGRPIVEETGPEGGTHWRTALRPRPMHRLVAGYPAHFADTACAFLLEDGRCALQCLAEARGLHPWHFKPLACWLHPISISAGRIELCDETTDPHRDGDGAGFASQTFCGRSDPCGEPAHRVLREELDFLAQLLGWERPRSDGPAAP